MLDLLDLLGWKCFSRGSHWRRQNDRQVKLLLILQIRLWGLRNKSAIMFSSDRRCDGPLILLPCTQFSVLMKVPSFLMILMMTFKIDQTLIVKVVLTGNNLTVRSCCCLKGLFINTEDCVQGSRIIGPSHRRSKENNIADLFLSPHNLICNIKINFTCLSFWRRQWLPLEKHFHPRRSSRSNKGITCKNVWGQYYI